jgi:RNA polymerase sigma-70 factor, ECF subfamily
MERIRGDIDGLLRSHSAGDPRVIEAMVVDYRAPLFRLALSILHDQDEAEDAVQDAFIAAAAALGRYQVGSNFKAWLYTIAVNTCRSYLRRRAARTALSKVLFGLQHLRSSQPGPESTTIRGETRQRLWGLVDQLGEKHRLVLVLRVGHDLTIHQISQVLGIPEKTVYTRLYDALSKLRRRLVDFPEAESLLEEYQA